MEATLERVGKVGNSEKSQTDEKERSGRREMVQVNHQGLARRNREKRATLAEVGEEDQRVLRIDDVTGK